MSIAAIAPKTPHFGKDWRATRLSTSSTAGGQTLNARIGYSIGPRWTMTIKDAATSKGVATLDVGSRKFSVPVAKGQSAKVTAEKFQKELKAAGFGTQLFGNGPLSPAKAQEAAAKLADDKTQLQAPNLSAAEKSRLETDVEILKEQLTNKGFYDLSFTTEK